MWLVLWHCGGATKGARLPSKANNEEGTSAGVAKNAFFFFFWSSRKFLRGWKDKNAAGWAESCDQIGTFWLRRGKNSMHACMHPSIHPSIGPPIHQSLPSLYLQKIYEWMKITAKLKLSCPQAVRHSFCSVLSIFYPAIHIYVYILIFLGLFFSDAAICQPLHQCTAVKTHPSPVSKRDLANCS